MQSFFSAAPLKPRQYFRFGRLLFVFFSLVAAAVYAVLHLLLYRPAFFQAEEAAALLPMAAVSAAFTLGVLLLLFLADAIQKSRWPVRSRKVLYAMAVMAALFFSFTQAGAQTAPVTRKDAATGLQTTYSVLAPIKTKMAMNGELLGHAQIPLGEKFTILNEGVSGFVQKGGKVSIGCSLTITDASGKELMKMADLFAAKDVFTVADSKFLKCTVNTGKPMAYDKKYNVLAVFWDKWGKGKITNRVTIEMIDLP